MKKNSLGRIVRWACLIGLISSILMAFNILSRNNALLNILTFCIAASPLCLLVVTIFIEGIKDLMANRPEMNEKLAAGVVVGIIAALVLALTASTPTKRLYAGLVINAAVCLLWLCLYRDRNTGQLAPRHVQKSQSSA